MVPDRQYPESAEETKAIRTSDDAFAKAFKDTVWPAFISAIESSDGPRFAVIDFAFIHSDGRVVRVLTSIGWCPDKGVPAKTKMTFASTKTAFESKINIGTTSAVNGQSYDCCHRCPASRPAAAAPSVCRQEVPGQRHQRPRVPDRLRVRVGQQMSRQRRQRRESQVPDAGWAGRTHAAGPLPLLSCLSTSCSDADAAREEPNTRRISRDGNMLVMLTV